jgi:hypothetical protein
MVNCALLVLPLWSTVRLVSLFIAVTVVVYATDGYLVRNHEFEKKWIRFPFNVVPLKVPCKLSSLSLHVLFLRKIRQVLGPHDFFNPLDLLYPPENLLELVLVAYLYCK